jgi:sec-independent protein translocase protein TatB
MFDFDFGKLMVVAIVALAVIPPKDLPRVMRTVGQVVGKMRRMAAEFQGQFMDAMREADLDSVRKELEALNDKAKAETSFDPAAMIRDDVTKAVQRPTDIGTSAIALEPPETAPPAHEGTAPPAHEGTAGIESDLDNVRRELEALNEKAKADASRDPAAIIGQEAADIAAPTPPSPGPHETPAATEVPAPKQSAAE